VEESLAADPTRRAVLTATAALPLVLTGCKGLSALSGPAALPADVTMLQHAIAAEALLAARYRAAIGALAASPAAAAALRPVLAEHEEHLARLRGHLVVPAAARPGGQAPAAGARHPAAALPAGPRPVLAYLEAAERDAAARLDRQLLSAPAPLAQLLASIAASEATHVPVLAAARRAA
jgi:hypothetical protein